MSHTDNLQLHFSSTTVRYWLTFIAFNLLSTLSFAQLGSITGEIRDKGNNETLIGAAVVIKGTLSGASADLDGRYTIAKVTPGSYTLTVQYLGYQPLEVSGVVVTAGGSTRVDLYLEQESTSLSEVKVTAEALKTSISTIQMIQKNSLGVMDGLSADQIKKSPDRNTADVLKRTSGTNIQDGKYVVVRGLNERYNLALVNGAMLPGTEPDKKAFSFDLFPSGMLDNLIIIKSAQPDLPGEFAGGIIRINTRDVPDDPFFNISVGTGMNTQATFREYRRMQGSSTDWLGYDKDFRTLPADWPVDRATLVGLPAEQRLALSRQFRNSYATDNRTALPYGSFQMSGGTKALLGSTELGVIGALSYSTSQRVNYSRASGFGGVGGGAGIGDSMGVTQLISTYNDTAFHTDVNWGAMLNFSARFGPNHRIFLKNAFNITSDNIFTAGRGFRTDGEFVPYRRYQYEFTTNQLLTSQLGGDHSLLKNKVRVDWVASSSRNRRDQPDFRRIRLLLAPNAEGDTVSVFQPQFQPNDADGYRFFAGLSDEVNNALVNITIPFRLGANKHEFKTGVYAQSKRRTFTARPLGYARAPGSVPSDSLLNLPLEQLFDTANIRNGAWWIDEITNPGDRYDASSSINAAYAMMVNKLGLNWKVIWGVRFERFNQKLNWTTTDGRDSVEKDYPDLLPSLNLIYSLSDESNLRFGASRTLSRPEFREIAPFTFYDFDLFAAVAGNPTLVRSRINNFDFRYERFFTGGQMFSMGVFYKTFEDPIEQNFPPGLGSGIQRGISWLNSPTARTVGTELVVRKNINKNLVVSANLTLINSVIEIPYADSTRGIYRRPMQGQAPFIANVVLQYNQPSTGMQFNVFYNQVGRQIAFVGQPDFELADFYENSRPMLDFQMNLPVGERGNITFSAGDIINRPRFIYQDLNGNKKVDNNPIVFGQYEYKGNQDVVTLFRQPGRTFSLGFSYKL